MKNFIELVNQNVPQGVEPRFLYFCPECNASEGLPFSTQYIFTNFLLDAESTEHDTLPNDDPLYVLTVLIKLMVSNKPVRFDEEFLRRFSLDGFLKCKLSNEND